MAQTVYSPAINTYTPLATITLSSSASSVTFSNINQSFRDLVLVISARSTASGAGDNLGVYFNSNTANYSTVRMYGTGSATGSNTAPTSARIAQIAVPAASTSELGVATLQVMDYSATDKHTTVLVRSNNSSDQVHAAAGRWGNTAAITSIVCDLYATSANFVAGSTFSLYGIAA